ncbi:MAG: pro-sigmaK processing inhibitor BofA family protein [Negativicutes bacterium]|nr:pro-sigmaK processing inhibitor BofA family protein [Negativicutes bacterium]
MFESSIWIPVVILLVLYFIGKIFSMSGKLVWNAIIGWGALWLVNSLAPWTGFTLPVNIWIALGVGIFGLPGLCALIIYQLFFI